MAPIRVLIVDDSSFARDVIAAILSTDREITVVGEAVNGRDAVEKTRELKPDIVTMDIEMPVMDGLEAIERIMASNAVPILVVTSRGDAATAYAAIAKGALDLMVKPEVNIDGASDFIDKIKMLSRIRVITHMKGKSIMPEPRKIVRPDFRAGTTDRIVAIASSTGGPEALSLIFSGLPGNFPCPIVVAQHISDGFVPGMAAWLKSIIKMNVKVGTEGEIPTPGTVYLSPSEKHMALSDAREITFVERIPNDIYRPSCDVLLSSVARVYGSRGVGVILTGMGSDGVRGMRKMKDAQAVTIAQDEKSSIVFGMPKVAIENGCIDKILSIDEIGDELVRIMRDGNGLIAAQNSGGGN